MTLDALHDDETWTDTTGTRHRIADMEPRYCQNVVTFLHRNVESIADQVAWELTTMTLPDEHTQAHTDVSRGIDEMFALLDADPAAWLDQQPLLKALRERASHTETEADR